MKGVSFSRLRWEESVNEAKPGVRPWRMAAGVVALLLLSSLLGAAGVASALPSDPEFSVRATAESRIELTIGTMSVEMVKHDDGYQFTYRQGGAVNHVAVVEDAAGVRYSINGGPWSDVASLLEGRSFLADEPLLSSNPVIEPNSHRGPTKYWWDGVRFVKGYPTAYAHPDRGYYHIVAKSDWRYWGIQLLHFQFGTDHVGLLATVGPVGIGIAIGAVIGWIIGGTLGSAVGSILGGIIGGILAYFYNVVFVDEAGAIWWWINRGLFSAINSIPWWLWFCGRCVEAYIAAHIDYLRIGSWTANNDLGIWGP